MADKTYEMVVIGSGPGGYVAAIRAAQAIKEPGAVAIVEADRLGGTCLNWGCIPTKTLIRSATMMREIKESEDYGISVDGVNFDLKKVVGRSRDIAGFFNKNIGALMKKNKIDVLEGFGRVTDTNTFTVTNHDGKESEYGFKKLIVATGCKSRPFPGADFDHQTVINSKDAMLLETLPKSMAVIGAGAIGIEFAYYYSSFGTEVTVIEMQDRILPVEDKDISKELQKIFTKKYGVNVLTSSKVESLTVNDDGSATLHVADKNNELTELTVEKVLIAIGVIAMIDDLFPGSVKPEIFKDHIKVDKQFATTVPNVYAIGDCIGPPWLAHVASHEAINCVEQIYGITDEPLDYNNIPGCTYCEPQVASIGMTERAAIEAGNKVKVGKIPFKHNGYSQASGHTEGFVKLIYSEPYGELLGAHIIGHNASDLIAELGLARKLEATFESVRDTIHAHPTLSELMMEASQQAGGWVIHG